MAEYVSSFKGLSITNQRIDGLMADFSGLNKLGSVVDKVLRRLALNDRVQTRVTAVKQGNLTMREFDVWFSDVVRVELGKTLGIVRAKAVQKAQAGGAGSAAYAVLRRMYKDRYAGAIHDLGNGGHRISSKKRVVPEPDGGVSGIRRPRTVSKRTKDLREYYGPDRAFILRFLEGGTDVRTARTSGPTGHRSKATYGHRGNINPRGFFHSLSADMEAAANQLGETLIHNVEQWTQKQFKEIE